MYSVEVADSPDDLRAFGAFWRNLAARSDNDNPFMSFEWFSFFWPKFCSRSSPLLLLLKKDGEPAALVPLQREKIRWRGLPVIRMSFMANYFSIRTGIIASPLCEENVFDHVFRFLRSARIGFDIFCADMVVKDSATDRMLRQYCQRREIGFTSMPSDCNPFIRIAGTWDEYLATRSKHQRFNVRHLARLYERFIRHSVTTYTSEGLDTAAEKMFFISRKSWKFQKGTAICNDPVKMEFYRSFLRVAADAGWLSLRILEIDGTPAAFSYELRHKTTVYVLKIGYNDDFRKWAPGAFLMNMTIREAFDAGSRECELLGGREEWKLRMCDECREHLKQWVFNDTPYGKILHAWERRVVSAAKYICRTGARESPSASSLDCEAEQRAE